MSTGSLDTRAVQLVMLVTIDTETARLSYASAVVGALLEVSTPLAVAASFALVAPHDFGVSLIERVLTLHDISLDRVTYPW